MANHPCQRCGYEPRRPKRDAWADRHPAAAVCTGVFVGLPALYTVAGIILAYPWFFVPVLIVVCAVVVDRRMRRRAAIAARADYEHRDLMAASLRWPSLPREMSRLAPRERLLQRSTLQGRPPSL